MKKLVALFFAIIMVLSLTACSGTPEETTTKAAETTKTTAADTTAANTDNEVKITFKGLAATDGVFSVTDLKTYEVQTRTVTTKKDPDGKEIKGALLSEIIKEKYGVEQNNLTSIKAIASDDYEVEIPANIIKASDIIIVYEEKGAPATPYLCLPDAASNYWAKNIVTLEFSEGA